jgi:hypothetical protein
MIAAIIATIISTQFASLLSQSGRPSISAESNSNFLGMTWSAVAIQAFLTGDAIAALIRYRARHCRCDGDILIEGPVSEAKRLFSGYD